MKHEAMNVRKIIRAQRLLAEQGHAGDTLGALNELAALRKDAARYRKLRDGQNWPAAFARHDAPEPLRGVDLDAACDGAA